jgi:RNA polymerase sigma factor FliA
VNLTFERCSDQDRYQQAGSRLGSTRRKVISSNTSQKTVNSQLRGRSQLLERQRLLLLHLPQVRLVAKGIWDRMKFAVELDDLVGYGTIGLMHAVERFDPQRGILLKTYAEHRIRGAILDGLREMDWLPRSARQKKRQQKEQQHDEEAGGVSCALHPGASAGQTVSKSEPGSGCGPKIICLPQMESVFPGGNLGDLEKLAESFQARQAQGGSGRNPEHLYERKEKFDQLAAAISRLPRRHQQILALYYQKERSMRQIGVILRVHESRVSQLHSVAVGRLRRDLSSTHHSSAPECRKPPQRYSPAMAELDSSIRVTAAHSSSVSTPMVSRWVSAT